MTIRYDILLYAEADVLIHVVGQISPSAHRRTTTLLKIGGRLSQTLQLCPMAMSTLYRHTTHMQCKSHATAGGLEGIAAALCPKISCMHRVHSDPRPTPVAAFQR